MKINCKKHGKDVSFEVICQRCLAEEKARAALVPELVAAIRLFVAKSAINADVRERAQKLVDKAEAINAHTN